MSGETNQEEVPTMDEIPQKKEENPSTSQNKKTGKIVSRSVSLTRNDKAKGEKRVETPLPKPKVSPN